METRDNRNQYKTQKRIEDKYSGISRHWQEYGIHKEEKLQVVQG